MPKTLAAEGFSLAIEYYREEDGRWLADIAALPGANAYGRGKKQATAAVEALALRLVAERKDRGQEGPTTECTSLLIGAAITHRGAPEE